MVINILFVLLIHILITVFYILVYIFIKKYKKKLKNPTTTDLYNIPKKEYKLVEVTAQAHSKYEHIDSVKLKLAYEIGSRLLQKNLLKIEVIEMNKEELKVIGEVKVLKN